MTSPISPDIPAVAGTVKKTANNNKREIFEDPLNIWRFENDWNVSALACCEDVKLTLCSYLCFYFVLCTLTHNIKDNICLHICVPCPFIFMRTKMRSNLRIRVSFSFFFLLIIFILFYFYNKGIYVERFRF